MHSDKFSHTAKSLKLLENDFFYDLGPLKRRETVQGETGCLSK